VNVTPLALDIVGATWQPAPPALTLQLQTQLPAGHPYVVEWTANFVNWQPLQNGNATGAIIDITDTTANPEQKLYGLRVLP
jgi:hypothetical protein